MKNFYNIGYEVKALIGLFFMMIIYTAYFILVTLNFYVYKKITGERFNDKLLKYKEDL